jgi:hypothetical protein
MLHIFIFLLQQIHTCIKMWSAIFYTRPQQIIFKKKSFDRFIRVAS